MEAGDAGEVDIAATATFLGFEDREPAALLLVEAAEDEVHPMIQPAFGIVVTADTGGAPTGMDWDIGHDHSSRAWTPGVRVNIMEYLEPILERRLYSINVAAADYSRLHPPVPAIESRALVTVCSLRPSLRNIQANHHEHILAIPLSWVPTKRKFHIQTALKSIAWIVFEQWHVIWARTRLYEIPW